MIGEHDFVSFCNVRTNTSDTVRTVYDIMIDQNGEDICIRITGNGFLYNMVRIIAGTLIRVGRGFYTPERVKEILEAGRAYGSRSDGTTTGVGAGRDTVW